MANNVELVVRGNNKFGANFFSIAARSEDNLVISPFSAHVVLAMVYQGAGGLTAEELGNLLGVSDAESAADGYQGIIKQLREIKSVTLGVANKIYLMKDFTVQTPFQNALATKFYSKADVLDFGDKVNSAGIINNWVAQNTHDKIQNLIEPDLLDCRTRLVLVNAVYFKGNWARKFNKEHTVKRAFFLTDNSETEVDMMFQRNKFRYGTDSELDSELLEMSYEGDELSMLIILPNQVDGITKLQAQIKDVDIKTLMENMCETNMEVYVPKFKIETTSKMNKMLKEMGASDMFTDEADFLKIAARGEELKVSDVIQKAFIEVNEEGAEAAAATGKRVMMKKSLKRGISFVADHPFIFYLVEKSTNGNILFMGLLHHGNTCSETSHNEPNLSQDLTRITQHSLSEIIHPF